jgi:hypothetical protein
MITYLTLFVFSKWMNSCRSLDSGRIWALGHDQVKQQLQLFISGQRAVILIYSFIPRRSRAANDLGTRAGSCRDVDIGNSKTTWTI